MQISEAVYRALTSDPSELLVVADWIEENFSGHSEGSTYCHRLRNFESVTIQTLVDVIAKFGTRRERREICRIQRLALRCRKCNAKIRWPRETKTLAARRSINFQLGNIIPSEHRAGRYHTMHKKVVIASCKDRRAFLLDLKIHNPWWFLEVVRNLLKNASS